VADSDALLGRVIPLAVTSCPAPLDASKIPRAAIKVASREPLTADQRPRQAHVVFPKPHPSAASEGCCTPSPVSRTPAPQCVGSAIANKAVAEKKIIATGKRNDGVHEINAGAAPRLHQTELVLRARILEISICRTGSADQAGATAARLSAEPCCLKGWGQRDHTEENRCETGR
jgi:hypothetical protein